MKELDRPLDRLYALYEKGIKKGKAPKNYIDYFEVAHFLLTEIDIAKNNKK